MKNNYYIYLNCHQINHQIIECVLFDLENKKIYDPSIVNEFDKKNDLIGDNYVDFILNDELYEEYLVSYPEDEVFVLTPQQLNYILGLHPSQIFSQSFEDLFTTLKLEEYLI
jgi:hypothetical protein